MPGKGTSSSLTLFKMRRDSGGTWERLLPTKTSTKVGLAILAIFVFGFAAVILVAVVQGGAIWSFILGMALFCGSIFGTIAWATRRSLRNIQKARRKR
jgi:hypothetical protein